MVSEDLHDGEGHLCCVVEDSVACSVTAVNARTSAQDCQGKVLAAKVDSFHQGSDAIRVNSVDSGGEDWGGKHLWHVQQHCQVA